MKNFEKFSRLLAIVLAFAMVIPGMSGIVEAAPEDAKVVERLAGDTRVGTAVEASKKAYEDGSDTVVLAGYNGTVDALTGTLLAKAKDAPLLLTTKGELSEGTEKEIERLEAKSVYIVGGENVVSKDVEDTLVKKYTVERISGERREETAQKIAEETGYQTEHVFLALGHSLKKDDALADALAVGPASAKKEMPVLLTTGNKLSETTKEALSDLKVKEITIVGGEKAISDNVVKTLKDLNYKVNPRVAGDKRENTALKIANKYFANSEKAIVAYGWNDADALVGGYIGAKIDAPILLAQTDKLSEKTEKFLEENINFAYVLGGKQVISDLVKAKIVEVIKTEVSEDIIVDKTIKLNKDYKSVKVTGDDIEVDLNGKTVQTLTVSGNNTTIKNGKIVNIKVDEDVLDLILEDIVDDEDSEHDFAGGGSESIILKGNTNLSGNVTISSKTPIRIKAEGLNKGKGITGKVTIDTDKEVTIGVPVNKVEVKKANKDIKIEAEVTKVVALADTKVTVGKDVKMPKLEKALGVTAKAEDSAGVEEDFEEASDVTDKELYITLSIDKKTIDKGYVLKPTKVKITKGESVWDVLKREMNSRGIDYNEEEYTQYNNVYIQSIDGDGEFDHGTGSGWKYNVDGVYPDRGVSQYRLNGDETVPLRYTTNQGEDLGTGFDDPDSDTNTDTDKESDQDKDPEPDTGTEKPHAPADSSIPADFKNDLWLSTNFQVLELEEEYELTSRRVPEIIDNFAGNNISHPPYTYEIIEGDSITLEDTNESNMKITAVKRGTSIIEVGYEEVEANRKKYGAISSVNKSYMIVDVVENKDVDNGIELDTDIKIRSYDTIYFDKGDTIDYSFNVTAEGNDSLEVTCNGQVVEGNGNNYTVPLENRSNIIGITATKGEKQEKLYYVIDARKIEINIENLSRPNEDIAVDDEVNVSFRGITPPIYKLATIYNPTWYAPEGMWEPTYGTTVRYTNSDLGELISWDNVQYGIADHNAIKFTVTEEKTYKFTDGYIDCEWWGSPLGTEKDMTGPGNPNIGAPQNRDDFSIMPNFEIEVQAKAEIEDTEAPEIEVEDLTDGQEFTEKEHSFKVTVTDNIDENIIPVVTLNEEIITGTDGS